MKSQYDYLLTSDYNREDTNFNLYQSIINVEASVKPLSDLYKGRGIKPHKFVLNADYKGDKGHIDNLTSSNVKDEVIWDERVGKLLLKEKSSWIDVEGNKLN